MKELIRKILKEETQDIEEDLVNPKLERYRLNENQKNQ